MRGSKSWSRGVGRQFKREGDCLAAKLWPGNVRSADDWEELLLPEIEWQQKLGKEVVFRADAAFAKPQIYEAPGRAGREVCHPHSGQREPGARHRGIADAASGKAL
jgi:hypothetical protein